MKNPNLYLQSALGVIPVEAVDAMVEENLLRASGEMNCLDSEGTRLLMGGVYQHPQEGCVQILREEFGAGNCMDTYYRVYYRNQDFKESWFVVGASWERSGRIYMSRLTKVEGDDI